MNAPHVVVIGGGVSGLAAAWHVARLRPQWRLTVLERGDRPGGTATTDSVGGFSFDRGPNGVLTNVPHTLDWIDELGLADQVVAASPAARRRYLYIGGRLRRLPLGLAHSSALGLRGVASVLAEPFRKRHGAQDEDVFSFMERRFGPRAAAVLAGPMVHGVSGGDPGKTEMSTLFPKVAAAERAHGSVLRGFFAGRGGPRTRLVSLRGGMGVLCESAANQLGDAFHANAEVRSVAPHERGGWRVELPSVRLRCDGVIVATPAPAAATLLAESCPYVAETVAGIPYAGLRVVTFAFSESQIPRAMDGFGYLVPDGSGLRTLGCVWASCVFPDRAPAGMVTLRVMLGGADDPEAVALPREEAVALALSELRHVLGVVGEPVTVHDMPWPGAVPQYERGHGERVASLRRAVSERPGLELCGNAYEGISLNESLASARQSAERLVAALG